MFKMLMPDRTQLVDTKPDRKRDAASEGSCRKCVYADMEHMGKGLRVHNKRVYVRRRT